MLVALLPLLASVGAAQTEPEDPPPPPSLRPLDDSDPEMKALLGTFFQETPCGNSATGLCEEAIALLRGGGDRLASYLITQYERNEAEGYPNHGTYLRLLGHTESTSACSYLTTLAGSRADSFAADPSVLAHQHLIFAIEGLGNTRQMEAIDPTLQMIDRFEDEEVRIRAVNALDRIQSKHGEQARVRERLLALRAERDAGAAANQTPTETEPVVSERSTLDWRLDKVLAGPGETYP
jgi:hypothetical protein